MLKNLYARVTAFVFSVEHTVEDIVAGFHTTIARLEAHAERKFDEAVRLENVITEADKALDAAHSQAEKAIATAKKIKELVS